MFCAPQTQSNSANGQKPNYTSFLCKSVVTHRWGALGLEMNVCDIKAHILSLTGDLKNI